MKKMNILLDFIDRLINDDRLVNAGYSNGTIIIPVTKWHNVCNNEEMLWLVNKSVNPISCIYYLWRTNPKRLQELFKNKEVLFLGDKSYFKINFAKVDLTNTLGLYMKNIKSIINNEAVADTERAGSSSPKAIKMEIIDRIERSQKITINNLVPAAPVVMAANNNPKAVKPKTKPGNTEDKKADEKEAVEDEKNKIVEKIDDASK